MTLRIANLTLLTILVGGSLAQNAHAQILKDELPFNARGIDVEDRVGEFIPLDLIFTDEKGNKIGLGKFFKKDKPIVLTLNYSDCPGLCIAQLDNLTMLLKELGGDGLGEDYEIVTVSIDPSESHEKAARTKAKYTGLLRSTQAEESWHFLVGKQKQIKQLADAVGFKYTYDRVNKRYNHAAATYFISPDGRICRYFLSLGVEPEQFKLAVAEADRGKLTLSVADAFIQFCYLYDPDANRYSASARRIMAFGGAAFCLMVFGGTAPFWFSKRGNHSKEDEAKSSSAAANQPGTDGTTADSSAASYNETNSDHSQIEVEEVS